MSADDIAIEKQALALLEQILIVPESEREAWLTDNRPEDPKVEARLRKLLESAGVADGLIETGGMGTMSDADDPPERVGAYAIEGLIGEGGMGAVFRGRRDAGDFDHEVAIKLIRPGALTPALIERFERERQILAGLSHPHIARLYDGGTSDDGNPYIIMEYIEGMPIVKWADSERLDLDARMALFETVCEAVRFAHQNLIVHRDLTPSNVLVTPEGQAKLIDFGIAKPPELEDGQGGNSKGSLTGLSLTPGFAAPERIAGAPTSTLTDIYSLGKLLKLLVVRWMGDGDIAAIVAKATADEPDSRYLSTDALLDDVQRFRSGRAVAARGGGRAYVLRKFVSRQKFAVAAIAAIVLLLVGGLTVSLIGFGQARTAQAEAEARFGEVREMANTLLFDIYDSAESVPGTTETRRMLAATGQRYLDALAADPDAPVDVRLEAGRGYTRLADVMGGAGGGNLGLRDEALANYERADEILTALYEAYPTNEDVALALANLRYRRSLAMVHITSEYERGMAFAQSIGPILDRACEDRDQCVLLRAQAFVLEGENLHWLERPDDALARYDRALAEIEGMSADFRQTEDAVRAEARAYFLKSRAFYAQEDFEETVRQTETAAQLLIDAQERDMVSPGLDRDLAGVEFVRGGTLNDLERTAEALPALNRAHAIMQRLVAADPEDMGSLRLLAVAGGTRALTLASAGDYEQAIEGGRAALDIRQRLASQHPDQVGFFRDVAIQLKDLGDIYSRSGRVSDACRYWRRAIEQFDTLDRRWGLSDFDRNFAYAQAQESLNSC
ncbi:protein kinase [Parasphingopyxis sp.]|uniref:protein kinase domain-containing protein n=1 Tax=Parasphingopyxis sp. TaxID=1920299 RepID=UPI002606C4A5|nr:protein kinase [Parasphingopyxis sp.]